MNELDNKWPVKELKDIIPHIFFSRKLPTSEQKDLIEIELNILRILKLTTAELNISLFPDSIPKTCKLFQKWIQVQEQLSSTLSSNKIVETIQSLESGEMLCLYIRAQNAGLFISIPEVNKDLPKSNKNFILSSFQASIRSESIMSTPGNITVIVPESSILVSKSNLLHSKVFTEQLGYLCRDQIDMALPKSFKAGHEFNEVRDVADPMFITDWVTATLWDENSAVCRSFPQIRKKIRDDVNWDRTYLPFRRSGLWMTTKVALQISLIRELGEQIGLVVYKAILIKVMHFILMTLPDKTKDGWDLKMQMMAKLARRLEKLKSKVSKFQELYPLFLNGITHLVKLVSCDIRLTRNIMDTQWTEVINESKPHRLISVTDQELSKDTVHTMEELTAYIKKRTDSMKEPNLDNIIGIPTPKCPFRWRSQSFPDFSSTTTGYNRDFELCDIEMWVRKHLEEFCSKEFSKPISTLTKDYLKKSAIHYKDDPVASSRMVLTVLKCLQVLDKIAVAEYPILKEHKSGVELEALRALIIPLKCDMKLLHELENYFICRDSTAIYSSLIDDNSPDQNSFSVRFARQSEEMKSIRTLILEKAERDIEEKKAEVVAAREKCQRLQLEINSLPNLSPWQNSYLEISALRVELNNKHELELYSVTAFERPLPNGENDQYAVVFELLIPTELADYRDLLQIFRADVCCLQSLEENFRKNRKQWKSIYPLSQYCNGEGDIVALGSQVASTLETHYTKIPVTNDLNSFILNNGMDLIYNAKTTLTGIKGWNLRHRFNIEKSDTAYNSLQWAVDDTSHFPNEVLANQYSCPHELCLSEFIQFGNLRAGHRLQYRNIIMSLVNSKLSLKAEPVFMLLCQAQWQVGPHSKDFLRESHLDFSEIHFARESLTILTDLVDTNSKNWSDTFIMLNLIVITSRLLELTTDTNLQQEAAKLLRRCRKISDEWIKTIHELVYKTSKAPENVIVELKSKLLNVALCSTMTFHVSPLHIELVMSSSEDLVLWLNASSTLYDEIHWNSTGRAVLLSSLQQSVLRLSICIGVSLEYSINNIISTTAGAGLSVFTTNRWTATESCGLWQQCDNPNEQVYECQAISNKGTSHVIHVDILLGTFLVDGCPVGVLPEEIVNNEAFQRVFSKTALKVQPNKDRIFTTTSEYHESTYDFSCKNNNLIVDEVRKISRDNRKRKYDGESTRKLELVSHALFNNMLPLNFIENHSHWWNPKDNTIIFRPKSFDDPKFVYSEKYILYLTNMILTESKTNRRLISVKSSSFSKLNYLLKSIELSEYIHIWLDGKGTIEIELARLGLKFILKDGTLVSKEFPGMQISLDQKLGTFISLQNKLVLDGKRISKSFNPVRKVIVPHGNLHSYRNHNQDHQTATVDLRTLREPQYFVYKVDERLQIIKTGRSQSAWFFLAALHAATSSPLPDTFTGVTGTEMAFQILQSPRCWSYQPYDQNCLKILEAISNFSPKRYYYPAHLKSMQQVKWPHGLPTTSAHDGFAMIVLKLYQDSKRLANLFKPAKDERDSEKTLSESNQNLGMKHYWLQQPLCNQLSTISNSFDNEFEQPALHYNRESFLDGRSQRFVDIQTIAHLCQNWKFHLDNEIINKLRSTLITSEDLTGQSYHGTREILNSNVKDWVGFTIQSHWIKLYCFALAVEENNCQLKWSLILSTLAFLGVPIDQILILQAVAVHPENFPEVPHISMYICPNDIYSRDVVLEILLSNAKPFEGGYGYYQHGRDVRSQAGRHANLIHGQWPTSSYCRSMHETTEKIKIKKAEILINEKLEKWYENHQLEKFVTLVEEKLKSLVEVSSPKPQVVINDLVTQERSNELVRSTFLINFKQMMTTKTLSTVVDQNATEIYEKGSCDSLDNFESHEHNLEVLSRESKTFWNCLTELMTAPESNALVASGLYPRLVPTTLLPILLKPKFQSNKWKVIQNLVGSVGVLWTMEQRLIRCITYEMAGNSMEVALQREIETKGHENWSPLDNPGWLILELEMNMMIRDIQLKVAQEMMTPRTVQNSVMQLNMGEGKTSLIVPMLAILLANGKQLCRVTVLKSIFETNLNHLRHTLGGLLQQRVYVVPCRRDLEMNLNTTTVIRSIYEECLERRGIVVSLPEFRLSFQLKGYEMARNGEADLSESLIGIQKWLNVNTRDILDESDEILSVKYQLVYTVGDQLHVGGGEMRWIIVQKLLKLLPQRMKDLFDKHGESSVEYNFENNSNPEIFTPCRLLRKDCYQDLIDLLADDFLAGILINFLPLSDAKKQLIKSFLTNNDMPKEDHAAAFKIFENTGDSKNQEIVLILAGYLRYGVLQAALGKRWRVNYGVNQRGHRKMAVPFKAKDVASERTEFGHPDMAIFLTQLSYYYSGLTDDQLRDCFDILKIRSPNPAGEYDSWIQTIPTEKVHISVKYYNGINISDYEQRTKYLFPILRKAMIVIDFWLSNIVFPKESKQFPGKMTCTAWDLTSENQKLLTTGFSGTNDSSNLYPLTISQNDLEELKSTNKKLEATLLKEENNSYKALPCGIKSRKLLEELHSAGIKVLLDCGALMLELNNEQVAETWLEIDQQQKQIQAVVYFNNQNTLTVKSRDGKDVQFELSPYRDRMDVCAVYLDDEHTRGTDLKFPRGAKACVTIGSGLTRDKMVQACMRMRMLGKGHTVSFWSSHEAHNKIREATSCGESCTSKDVLQWVQANSRQFESDGLIYWTASGVNYCRKMGAEAISEFPSGNETSTKNEQLTQLGEHCSEKEVIKLLEMYGQFRLEDFFVRIIPSWFSHAKKTLALDTFTKTRNIPLPARAIKMFANVETKVLHRCQEFIPEKKNFTQLLDEEQEKELEQELEEEKQVDRPHEATPHKHFLDIPKFMNALVSGDITNLIESNQVFQLPFGFQNTEFWEIVQPDFWGGNVYVTTDFIKTIVPKRDKDTLDVFLRPPAWVISLKSKESFSLLLISPFEANQLIHEFRNGSVGSSKLHLYTPRLLPSQKILIDSPNLSLPPAIDFHLNIDLLSPLSLFSGVLYFSGVEEQEGIANFLGIIPRPRTCEQDEGFERGEIDQNGFVRPEYRKIISSNVRMDAFGHNPGELIRQILRTRNHDFIPPNSHMDKLVLIGMKSEFQTRESDPQQLNDVIMVSSVHEAHPLNL